jgi:hypothetical protein
MPKYAAAELPMMALRLSQAIFLFSSELLRILNIAQHNMGMGSSPQHHHLPLICQTCLMPAAGTASFLSSQSHRAAISLANRIGPKMAQKIASAHKVPSTQNWFEQSSDVACCKTVKLLHGSWKLYYCQAS